MRSAKWNAPVNVISLFVEEINKGKRLTISYFGAIAQLGERLTGSQEVVGSIPIGSTNNKKV